ncbi:MotA/TolQ/ExbB proton channel family protein [Aquitalea aquatica]|uniref:Biopolymer transport protein ExbB n=1 Tax=Aquitalea aquatica TaxID=3044273 RepID=A0A838YA13_9NEIS|nr:MotA/TolQ/ExbB proton channel family protein [Aquitalea magnusonii]MBA4710232.1 MotA/TolQ/ExbB proton channel family protein [Aquitalea magnusonii]
MDTQLGLAHFWQQGDAVSHTLAILLVLMSIASWSLLLIKLLEQWRLRQALRHALPAFWQAGSKQAAQQVLVTRDGSQLLSGIALQAEHAAQAYAGKSGLGLGGGLDAGEYLGRTLQQTLLQAQARLEQGLTMLASIGATAPFVGLFGTVWGIYHALISLSGHGQMNIDQVAGPVGEALIMTAIGLFVAIPAVLAYNACTRNNRLMLAALEGFAHGLHAYLVAGVRQYPSSPMPDGALQPHSAGKGV